VSVKFLAPTATTTVPNPYNLKLDKSGYLIITVNREPEFVFILGTTRERLYSDVRYRLASKDAFWGEEQLRNQLDELIWNHIPKREHH